MLLQRMLLLKCLNKFMIESQKEVIDGIILKYKNLNNINGKINLLIFITHHSSELPIKNYQKSTVLKEPMLYVVSVIQSQLIIFHQLVTLLKILQLQDIWEKRMFNKLISILMVQEEEMMKLWQEVHSLIHELLTNLLIKLVHKLNMYQLDNF